MRLFFTNLLLCSCLLSLSQTPITSVVTTNVTSVPTVYADGAETYNWGVSPNNTTVTLSSFIAGVPYSKLAISGSVFMRRVNNASITGNFTTLWAQATKVGTSPNATYNIQPSYTNDMNAAFNSTTLNMGTDNIFNNDPDGTVPSGSYNANNIERLDFIFSSSYSTTVPASRGIAIFDRGDAGANDAFGIAIITGVSGTTPTSYSSIVRVTSSNYGNFGPAISYRLYKGQNPANLLDDNLGFNTQTRGGVFLKLSDFGIPAGTPIYGYSVFAADFPVAGTPADLVDFNNATNFPTNTSNLMGGLDLLAFTGMFIETSLTPVKFISFNGVENNGTVNLNWKVANESNVKSYTIERSIDGLNFKSIGITSYNNTNSGVDKMYFFTDNIVSLSNNIVYYRIKQNDFDGRFNYSTTVAINLKNGKNNFIIYPNPIKDNLFVTIASLQKEQSVISILNAAGQKIISQQIELVRGNNSFNIYEIGKLTKGTYVISFKLSGKIVTQKFIKQ